MSGGWAIRRGWGGRPVRQERTQVILIATPGVLAAHLGCMALPTGSGRLDVVHRNI
jgi:hypothetical protein